METGGDATVVEPGLGRQTDEGAVGMDGKLLDWSRRAAEILLAKDSGVRIDVIERTTSTATRVLKVLKLPADDPLGPRLQIVPKGQDGGVEAALAEGAVRMDEVDRGPLQMEFDFGDKRAATSENKPGQPVTSGVPDDGPRNLEEAMALFSHAEAVLPEGQMPSMQAVLFISQLEQFLAVSPTPEFVKKEYAETMNFSGLLLNLAVIIFDHFGREAIDLALSMMVRSEIERGDRMGVVFSEARERILALPEDQKVDLFTKLMGQYPPGSFDNSKSNLDCLKWALGEKLFEQLAGENPEIPKTLDNLRNVLATREDLREKLLAALKVSTLTSDRALASAMVRQGWITMMEFSKEVTDYEWFTLIRDQIAAYSKDEGVMAEMLAKDSRRQRFEQQKTNIAKFFEANPQAPNEPAKRLEAAIGCDELRKQLNKVDNEHNPFAYAALQHEIACRVVRFVSRYRDLSREETPVWEMGLPTHTVETKGASCFSGPWLIAMMLLKCGIQESDLLYCNVNQGYNGMLGGHGSIIMKTKLGEMLLVDHGLNLPGVNMKAISFKDKDTYSKFGALLDGKRKEPVLAEVPEPVAERLHIHRSMQIMPITSGFASGHLLHVGMSFLDENKFKEARYAFELGLTFSRRDPDLLHGMAVCHVELGQLDEAEKACVKALESFEGHLWTHFTLADLYMRKGDVRNAKKHFKRIAGEKEKLYKGESMVANAKRFAGMKAAVLRQVWEDPGERIILARKLDGQPQD